MTPAAPFDRARSFPALPRRSISAVDFSVVSNSTNIRRVTLVKTGSVTHSVNMDQRFIELAFTQSSTTSFVQAPDTAGEAPPGYYMLFVIDDVGVPSVAKIMRVNIAG